jgi:hypothetical protein
MSGKLIKKSNEQEVKSKEGINESVKNQLPIGLVKGTIEIVKTDSQGKQKIEGKKDRQELIDELKEIDEIIDRQRYITRANNGELSQRQTKQLERLLVARVSINRQLIKLLENKFEDLQ